VQIHEKGHSLDDIRQTAVFFVLSSEKNVLKKQEPAFEPAPDLSVLLTDVTQSI
jgi:hypothetical protein